MAEFSFLSTKHLLTVVSRELDGLNQADLEAENDERFDEVPPHYVATRSLVSELFNDDEEAEQISSHDKYLRDERYGWYVTLPSLPLNQFRAQVQREQARLEEQSRRKADGRRQTLPLDESLNIERNAQNNVRLRWVEQGIWGHEWGPAWPRGIGNRVYNRANWNLQTLELMKGPEPPEHPFKKSGLEPDPSQPYPNSWGHEGPGSEDDASSDGTGSGISFKSTNMPDTGPPEKQMPIVTNREASWPAAQFESQVALEREWIRDEQHFKDPGHVLGNQELDVLARNSVRENWMRDYLWLPKWDEQGGGVPFGPWPHELPSRKRKRRHSQNGGSRKRLESWRRSVPGSAQSVRTTDATAPGMRSKVTHVPVEKSDAVQSGQKRKRELDLDNE